MTNLAKTQPQHTKFMRELCLFLAARKELDDKRRKFHTEFNRTQVVDPKALTNTSYSATLLWTFAGVVPGTNCDEYGRVWVRITDETPGAGEALVEVFKAAGAGGSDLVASGAGANGATVTLGEENDSGLTGTVKLGTISASEADDTHILYLFPDWPLRANAVFDGSEPEHTQALRSFLGMCSAVELAISDAIAVVEGAILAFLLRRGANFHRSSQQILINRRTVEDDGAISTVFAGLLEDMRQNMVDEATAGAQKVVKNVVTAGSVSFDANNQGQGTMSAPTMKEFPAKDGLVTAVCVSSTVGFEKFRLSMKVDSTGEVIVAQKLLEVGRPYADPDLGISGALLSRTHTITTPGSSTLHFNTTGTNWSFSDENEKNTNDGELYAKVIAGTVDPAKFIIQVFKSSSYQDSQLVAESSEGAAGDSVGLNPKKNSGLSGTAKLGSAPVVGNTATISLNCFRTQNVAAGVPDKLTFQVTVTSRGEIQRQIAALGYALNSAASGGETLSDGLAKAGTFVPYSVDNA